MFKITEDDIGRCSPEDFEAYAQALRAFLFNAILGDKSTFTIDFSKLYSYSGQLQGHKVTIRKEHESSSNGRTYDVMHHYCAGVGLQFYAAEQAYEVLAPHPDGPWRLAWINWDENGALTRGPDEIQLGNKAE